MAEQPVNLLTAIYLGVFSRAEQRVLQAIFKAIAEGGGRCVATLARLARDSNTSKSTTRNAITRAVEIGLLEKIERRPSCAVSLSNVLTYGKSHSPARSLILSRLRDHAVDRHDRVNR
jgi:DNA-binding IclR family transcriptional regulator